MLIWQQEYCIYNILCVFIQVPGFTYTTYSVLPTQVRNSSLNHKKKKNRGYTCLPMGMKCHAQVVKDQD